ncbi:LytR family transcriptional regulator [candidate division WOR-3 bacterium]|nr:LytR family transcriptional regulator [candidate division WOR-3 bacterium]
MKVLLVLLIVMLAVAAVSVAVRFFWTNNECRFDRKSVRLEVINGCGLPRVGRAVADELLNRGYNVYSVGNCIEHYARTRVVDLRDPKGSHAGKIARSLAVRKRWWRIPLRGWLMPDTAVALDSLRFLEARLVVGDDFPRYFAGAVPLH